MAKNAAAIEGSPKATKCSGGRSKCGRSIFQLALRCITGVLNTQRDRDVERFINARGGVKNDALDRELSRHFGSM